MRQVPAGSFAGNGRDAGMHTLTKTLTGVRIAGDYALCAILAEARGRLRVSWRATIAFHRLRSHTALRRLATLCAIPHYLDDVSRRYLGILRAKQIARKTEKFQ